MSLFQKMGLFQPSFFEPTAPHNRTETSIEAAIEVQPKIGRYQQMILDTIESSPEGRTRDELAMITGLPTATVCGRCNELVKMGRLSSRSTENGKIKRKTRSGKNAEVLFLQ